MEGGEKRGGRGREGVEGEEVGGRRGKVGVEGPFHGS